MDVLTSETCWALNNEIKSKWHQVGLSLFNIAVSAKRPLLPLLQFDLQSSSSNVVTWPYGTTLLLSLSAPWRRVSRGTDPLILNVGTKQRSVHSGYPLNRWLDGPRKRCGRFGEETNQILLAVIATQAVQAVPSAKLCSSTSYLTIAACHWPVIIGRWCGLSVSELLMEYGQNLNAVSASLYGRSRQMSLVAENSQRRK